MRILKLLLLLIIMVIITNLISDWFTANVGSSYGKNAIKSCLNDPELNNSQNILIGTSVTREINRGGSKLMINGDEFFICGISAPITNFDFHFLIANLVHNKVDLHNKKIMFEISLQGILNSSSILDTSAADNYLAIAPVNTKIFWLKGFVYNTKISLHHVNMMYKTIKAIILPTDGWRYLTFKAEQATRKNYYLKQLFHPENIKQSDLEKYERHFNGRLAKFRTDKLTHYVEERGGEVEFYLPPVNEFFTDRLKGGQIQQTAEYFKNLTTEFHTFDARDLNSAIYFADCCHFNVNGMNAMTHKLRGPND